MSDRLLEIQKRFKLVLRPYEETEDITVTELASRLAPQPVFELKPAEEEIFVEGTEEPQTPRNEFGNVFHRVMEVQVRSRSKSFKTSWLKKLTVDLNAAEQEEIEKSALRFWKGPWGARVRSAKRCYPELPFIYKTRYGILKGQIDLVFQEKNGAWTILDYKTNRVVPEGLKAASLEYEKQLAFYALAFKKLYGEAPKKSVLYFAAVDKVYEFDYVEADFALFERELEEAYRAVLT